MMRVVSINGRLLPRSQASVSVADGGFLHGEGIFETIRLYAGRPLLLPSHLRRAAAGLRLLGLAEPPRKTVEREIARVASANGVRGDAVCRLSLSRAPSGRGRATRVVVLRPLPDDLARASERGIRVQTLPFERATGPVPPIKSLSYLPSLLALRAADLADAAEALFISEAGEVREGATTNVFALVDGVLLTPPADGRILPGVFREHVLSLSGPGLPPVKESPLSREDLERASEVFLTNAVREIVPVIRLDTRPVGGGLPGPVTRGLQEAWRAYVAGSAGRPRRSPPRRRRRR